MKYQFPFEKLEVWKLAKDFCIDIYAVIQMFPDSEKYGLSSQIKRAAISVASNIAEGSSRRSRKDQAHYTQIAYSSMMEVACQLIISKDMKLISDEKYAELRMKIEEIANKLNALHKYQTSNK